MSKLRAFVVRVFQEPPFRLISRAIIKRSGASARTKAAWDAVARPHYLVGVLAAADQAKREGVPAISVMEFGVAGGNGLLALEACAEAVERETGVRISVFGFDTGSGIPELCGDYRDHCDQWKPSDYSMDEAALRVRLQARTRLVIGNVGQTVPEFVRKGPGEPVGFVAFDLDLYSSTRDALQIFSLPGKKMLRRVALYFDDVDFFFNHRFAGEFLAIDEFNEKCAGVKIDVWRGIAKNRVFPESPWLQKMYVAHDLVAISDVRMARPPSRDLQLESTKVAGA